MIRSKFMSPPESGAERGSWDPLLQSISPHPATPSFHRVQAVADWLRGPASQPPGSEAGAERARGGRHHRAGVRSGAGRPGAEPRGARGALMEHTHAHLVANSSQSWSPGSACGLGFVPVVYYSLLLCLGLPANILTVIILSQLVARRQKSSYNYLLALAAADILVLFFIVFVDFLLEDFILNMQMPQVPDKIVEVLEFSSIHTSIWITVPLTIDRYIAVCHPLKYHTLSYPARTRKVIVSVYVTCFLTSIPYYWWPNLWTEDYISTSMHHVLIWIHCFTVYLVPCFIFFILNSIIVYKLRRKSNFRLRGYSTGKTTAILFTITSIFATLWAPRIIMILYHLYGAPIQNRWLVHVMSDVANMLALLNTAINFFLYCFISKRFRTMAAATLKAFFKCQKQPVQFYTNHNFSITSSPWISPANSHCIKMLVYQYDKNGKPIKVSP
ncbi:hypothetical protein R6Z07M_018677 [Ovis aries]